MTTEVTVRYAGQNQDIPRPPYVGIPETLPNEQPIRIAVLSAGAVTPLGLSVAETLNGFKEGRSGIVEHLHPPYTEPTFRLPREVISTITSQVPLLGKVLDRLGDTPQVRQLLLDEFLIRNPEVNRADIKVTEVIPQIQARTAGIVPDFNPVEAIVKKGILPRKEVIYGLGQAAQYGLAASHEALSGVTSDSGVSLIVPRLNTDGTRNEDRQWIINNKVINPAHFAVAVGSGFGGGDLSGPVFKRLTEGRMAKGDDMMQSLLDRAASTITQAYGINGGTEGYVAACASSGKAMGALINKIITGRVLAGLALGTEGVLGLAVATAEFSAMLALDTGTDPLKVSRTLHAIRLGFTMAEGAVGFVLADYNWARKMGFPIMCEIIGYGDLSGGGHNTDPNGPVQEQTMRIARRMAEMHGPIKGWVLNSGHYTATKAGDRSEMLHTQNVLEDMRQRTLIFASKRFTGHMLGAAGNLSMLVACMFLQEGVVPGMTFDGEVMDEAYGWKIPRETILVPDRNHALVNQFGFGDANNAFWLRRAT